MSYVRNPNTADEARPIALHDTTYGNGDGDGNGNGYGDGYGYGDGNGNGGIL